ncbi:MAG TPA: MoaD/ThiS family protein [Polyangiaceae bacterium]|nr:MoaD/ThiS family protein [Polyangiaceae bacterium]
MPRLNFTPNLERHLGTRSLELPANCGDTLREVFDAAFARLPLARAYILDDQGGVRRHVAVFVDGQLVSERQRLAASVASDAEIWIMQALSGG